ncbi:MAG: pyridinium-3,5-biscarboxylic acid mononucleotide sulfurtransferase [Tepidanaerobacteraceae bacterium]|nr:pyridinium-3,5-biscarboxylic acid mononucleotide sulfurtransferase [Tepidanaerobacteraceae bacterium]
MTKSQGLGQKLQRLKSIIKNMSSAVVAFSGGVDSTFLLKVCLEFLGSDNVLAVTAKSAIHPEWELQAAERLARMLGVRHKIVKTEELEIPGFSDNPPERCYYCKKEVFGKLLDTARREGFNVVVDGSNFDDTRDFRPGMRATAELGIRSPLKEAGFTKDDIRALSKEMGLPTWNKPSFACLSSRFPYGEKITLEKLERVARAEEILRALGFSQYRVRSHGDIARIEVQPEDMERFFDRELREDTAAKIKQAGFKYVTLDLLGYRSGSMNEVLEGEQKALWKN